MLLKSMVLLPVFVKVAALGPPALPTLTLAQLMDAGERLAVLPEVEPPELESVPRPDSAICCGLLPELSVKFKLAVLVPAAVGLNRTVTVQLAEEGRDEPQVLLEMEKSPESVPVRPTLFIARMPPLAFVSVAFLGPPVWPTATLYQLTEEGETDA